MLGTTLKEMREKAQVGLKRLAREAGISASYLSKIENGKAQPSEDVITRLSALLGADPAVLLLQGDRIPLELQEILRSRPQEALQVLRDSFLNLDETKAKGTPAGFDHQEQVEERNLPEKLNLSDDESVYSMLSALLGIARKQFETKDADQAFEKWNDSFPHLEDDRDAFLLRTVFSNASWQALKANLPIGTLNVADFFFPDTFSWLSIPDELSEALGNLFLSVDPWQELSSAYPKLLAPKDIRHWGKVYTPDIVVKYILDRVEFPGSNERGCLLDPACGAGAFLIEAARRIVNQPDASFAQLSDQIVGFDNDPVAIDLCKTGIMLLAGDHDLFSANDDVTLNIFVSDTLDVPDQTDFFRKKEHPVVENIKSKKGNFQNGIHWIVGNPPYGKIHSSDTRVANFKETVYGHANAYGLFIHFCLDRLAKHGRLGFIVPKSFSSGLYFKKLRAYLLNHLVLNEVVTFGSRKEVFSDAAVLQETVVLLGGNGGSNGEIIIKEPHSHQDLKTTDSVVRAKIDEIDLGPEYDHILCLTPSRDALDLMYKVRQRSTPLIHRGLKTSTGKLVWNRLKKHLRDDGGDNILPLYWMHNIQPYRFLPEQQNGGKQCFAELNEKTKPWLNVPEEMLITKRISAKEQPRRIEAAYIPASWRSETPGYFLENHLNFIRRRDQNFDLVFLCGLLNSKLLDFVFRIFNGNTQVSASEINLLPLPEVDTDEVVVQCVQKAINAERSDMPDIEDELNYRVYEIYGLKRLEANVVEKFFKNYKR